MIIQTYTNFKLVYPLLIPFTMWLHLFNIIVPPPPHSHSHQRSHYDTLDLECASSEVKRVT